MTDELMIVMLSIFFVGFVCGIFVKLFINWTNKKPSGHMDLNPIFKEKLIDGQIYQFDYKSKSKTYDGCVMRYCIKKDEFYSHRITLNPAFCTNIVKMVKDNS